MATYKIICPNCGEVMATDYDGKTLVIRGHEADPTDRTTYIECGTAGCKGSVCWHTDKGRKVFAKVVKAVF